MQKHNLYIPVPLLKTYRHLAGKAGVPMAELMRAALTAWAKDKSNG